MPSETNATKEIEEPYRVVLFDDSNTAKEEFEDLRAEAGTPIELLWLSRPRIDTSVQEELLSFRPDLFVVDLNMGSSDVDGQAIIRRLQKIPGLREVPIVVCSKIFNERNKDLQKAYLAMSGVVAVFGKKDSLFDAGAILSLSKRGI